jgi:hypothetical protein
MKAKILTIFTLYLNAIAFTQNTDWEVHIGLSNRDEGARDLIEYYDKGYYIEGWAVINDLGKGWNIKTTINADLLWDNLLEHDLYTMYGWSVALDNEGNRYIAGNKYIDGTWPFVTKFNSCGEELWCRILQYDDEFEDGYSIDMIITKDNEIVILTSFDSAEEIDKIHLAGLNENGDVLWIEPYASKNDHPWILEPNAYHLMEHNHEYYISGYCYWPFPSDTTHYFLRPLFIGIDSLFNEKWILPFYALDSVFGDAYYSIPLNDSVIIGVGLRRVGNDANSLLMFYSNDGVEIGYNQIGSDQIGSGIISNYMREVTKINDSLFIGTGFYEPEYSTFYDMDFKTDTSANLLNFQLHPDVYGIPSLIKSSDNNYVIASTITEPNNDKNIYLYKIDEDLEFVPFDTNVYTYDSLCPEQIQSGIIDLSDCLVWTGTEEIPSPEEYYSFIATIPIIAYPNPAETEITIVFQNTEHHNNMLLECYNIYGQKVHSEKIWKRQQETNMDLQGLTKGLYFAVVKNEGKVAGTCRFVKN